MTDEQIIKALECCIESNIPEACNKCPLKRDNGNISECLEQKEKLSLDLIKRQKEEIEESKTKIERMEKELTEYKLRLKMSECTVDEIKSEEIRKFAEWLKSRLANLSVQTKTHGRKTMPNYVDDIANQILHDVVPQEIDKLVKEMTGGK